MDEVKNCEILFDTGSVNVKAERYDELVCAEATLKLIERMYHNSDSTYYCGEILSYIFGKKGADKGAE